MTNHRRAKFGIFKTILLSDLTNSNDSAILADLLLAASPTALLSATSFFLVSIIQCARAAKVKKKKAMTVVSAQKIGQIAKRNGIANRKKTQISLSVLIELIKLGSKRRVRVTVLQLKPLSHIVYIGLKQAMKE